MGRRGRGGGKNEFVNQALSSNYIDKGDFAVSTARTRDISIFGVGFNNICYPRIIGITRWVLLEDVLEMFKNWAERGTRGFGGL